MVQYAAAVDSHVGIACIHQRKARTVESSVFDIADTLVVDHHSVGIGSLRSGKRPAFDSQCSSAFVHKNVVGSRHSTGALHGQLAPIDELLLADGKQSAILQFQRSGLRNGYFFGQFTAFREIVAAPHVHMASDCDLGSQTFRLDPAVLGNAVDHHFRGIQIAASVIVAGPPTDIVVRTVAGRNAADLLRHSIIPQFNRVLVIRAFRLRKVGDAPDKGMTIILLHIPNLIGSICGRLVHFTERDTADRVVLDQHVTIERLQIAYQTACLIKSLALHVIVDRTAVHRTSPYCHVL